MDLEVEIKFGKRYGFSGQEAVSRSCVDLEMGRTASAMTEVVRETRPFYMIQDRNQNLPKLGHTAKFKVKGTYLI